MSAWLERLWYPDGEESLLRTVGLSPLWLASAGFQVGVAVRGALYGQGVLASHRVEGARVISVGNLTVGGAGKTPVVIHLARMLVDAGLRVAVLSRGHGREGTEARVFSVARGGSAQAGSGAESDAQARLAASGGGSSAASALSSVSGGVAGASSAPQSASGGGSNAASALSSVSGGVVGGSSAPPSASGGGSNAASALLRANVGRGEAGAVSALPSASEVGDEPRLIALSVPEAVVLVGPDRAALAERAVREHGAEVILLDDGMQHRRLARDLDLVVIDARVGFGNGHLMPRGPLREPRSALRRAHLLWLRGEPSDPLPPGLPDLPVVRARHLPVALLAPDGQPQPLSALEGREAITVAGLARPGAFLRTLDGLKIRVAASRLFPDHHPFSTAEQAALLDESRARALPLITTEKDRMRLPADFPAWVVRLGVEVTSGAEHLSAALTRALGRPLR